MKNNKLNKLWFLVILSLLLTACGGTRENTPETTTAETEVQTTAPEEQTQPATETTAVTTETTEATEETTEPTEETTAPTTGGSNSGSDDDDDDDSGSTKPTEAKVEVPDAGDAKNPYVEVVSDYPGQVSTVTIPTKGTISYLIWGSAGKVITIEEPNAKLTVGQDVYTADENGILTADLSGITTDAVISLANSGEEAKPFLLSVTEPLGSKNNPMTISDLAALETVLKAGDTDGIWYQWMAPATGTLSLTAKEKADDMESDKIHSQISALANLLNHQPESEMEEPKVAGTLTDMMEAFTEEPAELPAVPRTFEVTAAVGEKTARLSDSTTGEILLEVSKDEAVKIHVVAIADAEGNLPAVTAELSGSLAIKPGTRENPYEHTLTAVPETFTTLEIPGESQVYYNFIGAEGTVLTIADNACVIHENVTYGPTVNGSVWVRLAAEETAQPILLAIGNQNVEAKALTLTFAYEGSAECPAVLKSLDQIEIDLEAGDTDGYTYQWTAEDPGTLHFTLESIQPETAECDVTLSVKDTNRLVKLLDGDASIDVKAGETLILHVAAASGEDGACPEAKLTLSTTFTPAPGSVPENPLAITDLSVPVILGLRKEKALYISGSFQGQILTVYDAADLTMKWNDQTILPDENGTVTVFFPEAEEESPAPILLQLTSAEEKNYTLVFCYPLGTPENPDTMVLDENSAVLEAKDSDGYTFLWYADIDGELTITMPEEGNWQYTLLGEVHNSAEAPCLRSQTIPVTAGEELRFTVNTYDPENPEVTPAGTVTFTVSFYDPTLGTEANPIWLNLSDTVTIPAGKTIYYTARVDGMTMTLKGENVSLTHNGAAYTPVEGVITLVCKGASMMEPPVFAITNTGENEEVCEVTFDYPLGHSENPARLTLGQTEVTITEGDPDGWFFTWTAEEAGSFTVTMTEGAQWQYVVNNLTSGISGELHASDDDPVVLTETITVAAGDEIQIVVNTYNPENPFMSPGGTVVFTATFAK